MDTDQVNSNIESIKSKLIENSTLLTNLTLLENEKEQWKKKVSILNENLAKLNSIFKMTLRKIKNKETEEQESQNVINKLKVQLKTITDGTHLARENIELKAKFERIQSENVNMKKDLQMKIGVIDKLHKKMVDMSGGDSSAVENSGDGALMKKMLRENTILKVKLKNEESKVKILEAEKLKLNSQLVDDGKENYLEELAEIEKYLINSGRISSFDPYDFPMEMNVEYDLDIVNEFSAPPEIPPTPTIDTSIEKKVPKASETLEPLTYVKIDDTIQKNLEMEIDDLKKRTEGLIQQVKDKNKTINSLENKLEINSKKRRRDDIQEIPRKQKREIVLIEKKEISNKSLRIQNEDEKSYILRMIKKYYFDDSREHTAIETHYNILNPCKNEVLVDCFFESIVSITNQELISSDSISKGYHYLKHENWLLLLIWNLQNDSLLDMLCRKISVSIIQESAYSNYEGSSLTHVLISIFKWMKALPRARVFCYDLLRQKKSFQIHLFLAVTHGWSTVFDNQAIISKTILVLVSHLSKHLIMDEDLTSFNQFMELSSIIEWDPEDYSLEDLLNEIIIQYLQIELDQQKFCTAKNSRIEVVIPSDKHTQREFFFNIQKSLELIASIKGWNWSHDIFITELWKNLKYMDPKIQSVAVGIIGLITKTAMMEKITFKIQQDIQIIGKKLITLLILENYNFETKLTVVKAVLEMGLNRSHKKSLQEWVQTLPRDQKLSIPHNLLKKIKDDM